MSPDPRDRHKRKKAKPAVSRQVRTRPSPDDVHQIVFFRRHPEDNKSQSEPGREALNSYPLKVRSTMRAVLTAVAAAPPRRFAGGGYWEAMKGDMAGWFEVRVDGPNRHHYRLFCLLDYEAQGSDKPLLTVITGLDKPFRTTLSDADYRRVRDLGIEYRNRNPRSVC